MNLDELYKKSYQVRADTNPSAFTLNYWKTSFSVEVISNSNEIKGNILDLGCGTGEIDILVCKSKLDIKIMCVDICTEALNVAKKHLLEENEDIKRRILFSKALIENLPFEDNSFDHCFLSHTFEHIEDHTGLFKELNRVIKKNGTVIIIVPFKRCFDDPTHFWHFDLNQLRDYLGLYGESIKIWTSKDGKQIASKMRIKK